MKVSHEVPICLLEESLKFNDYDYILNHLLDKSKKYKDFYLQHKERFTILDNSAYEYFITGEKFDKENYIRNIKELQPNVYLIPDVLMDSEKTMCLFEDWVSHPFYQDSAEQRMVVVQGKTFKEWLDCYLFYWKNQNHFSHIAISFHYSFLKEMGRIDHVKSVDYWYAVGRATLLSFLVENKMIMDKSYHLLGSHIGGIEFGWYKRKGYEFIKTIDTGYPIKLGIEEREAPDFKKAFLSSFCPFPKSNIILDDFLEKELNSKQLNLINENIINFKNQTLCL